jgi:cation-transporting ATPase E
MSVFELGSGWLDLSIAQAQSGATLTLTALGLWVLYELARPLDAIRLALIAVLVVMGIGAFTIPFVADFFLLEIPPADFAAWIGGIVIAGCALISIALRVVGAELGRTE